MASPATKEHLEQSVNDGESDYGSDFSPEEAETLGKLLSWKPIEDVEDNPIVNEIEHHDPQRTLRLPRKLGREQMAPLFQAARAAGEVAEEIRKSIKTDKQYPDCKSPSRPEILDKSD
jgi:exonuclease V